MLKLVKQLTALFLSASFVVSGFAGLSPLLHVLIEHGGRGPLHVHHHNMPIKAQVFPSATAKGIRVTLRSAPQHGSSSQEVALACDAVSRPGVISR